MQKGLGGLQVARKQRARGYRDAINVGQDELAS